MNKLFCAPEFMEGSDCYDPSAAWVQRFCMVVGASSVAFFHVSLVYLVAPKYKLELMNWFFVIGLVLCWILAFKGNFYIEAAGATIFGLLTYLSIRWLGSPNKQKQADA